MALTERQKEQQILIRAMHSPYFTKQVLSKDVGALITTPILKEIANVVVRYYGTTDELLTLDTLNTKLEQRLIRRARVNKEEISEASIDKLFQIDSVLINSKEDNNETLLSDLESYIHTQLANEAILEEANAGSKNISERVAKRLDDINAIKLTGTKYEPLDILKDLDRKDTIYQQFGNKKIKSELKPLDILTGGGLEIGQIGLIAAPAGQGKAQPYSEPVMTPEGIKRMGDLSVGDYVYNRFGKSVKITDIFEKGKLDVYEVILQDGRKIRVNDEHLFSYFTKSGNLITKSLRDIINSGIYRTDKRGRKSYKYHIPSILSAIEYPKLKLSYDPYTLGALLGDGCLSKLRRLEISAPKEKLFILDKIIKNNSNLASYKRISLKNYNYSFILKHKISQRKTANLDTLGIRYIHEHTLSADKSIPEEMLSASISQRLELIRGLFDTDGSAILRPDRNNTLHVSYFSVSKKMARQIQFILWSLGYRCSMNIDKRIYSSGGNGFILTVQASNKRLAKLFTQGSPKNGVCLKANETKRRVYYDRLIIRDVKKLNYKENMRCIMVDDPEHLYVSGNYIVSHNTTFLTNLTYYYAMIAKRNVLHISLEELDSDQVLRFDRILTNTSIKDVFDDEGKIKDSYLTRISNYYHAVNAGNNHGEIYFEKSTPLTLNVDDIRQMINTVEREKQTKIEVIILDYADLLKKQSYSDNEAQSGELLFQDLVKLAQETNTLIFTATQLNRGSGLADVKTMDNIEGSYRKKNTIAFGATLNATHEERQKGYIRLYLDKVRNNYGFDDDFLYLKYDKKSMRLHAESPQEQAEHKSLVEQAGNNRNSNKVPIDNQASLSDVINEQLKGNK